jgi:hypothetical protein
VANNDFSTLLAGLDDGAKCALYEALTRELHGVSFQELAERAIEFGRQFERKQAVETAKKASKGGRPLGMAVPKAVFMVAVVDKRAPGVPIKKAVGDFLKQMAIGLFVRRLPAELSDQEINVAVDRAWKNRAKRRAMLEAAGLPCQDTAENIYHRKGDCYRQMTMADQVAAFEQVIEKIDKRHC